MEIGVLGQQLELLVQDLETFLRNLVRRHVINRNLQPFQTRVVQPLNALVREQVTVGDQSSDHAVLANAADNVIQVGVKQRFAAADSDN